MIFTLSSVLAALKKFREEAFECAICLETCTDTLVNPECNHRFCGKCIKESLHKCNHECPTCRVHIPTYRTCRRDPQFDHIVSSRTETKWYHSICVNLSSSWRRWARLQYCTLLTENCYCVQLDRLVKEFIVPLEKQISSEQEEKQVPEKHYRRLSAKRDVHVQARLVLVVVHQRKWLLPVGQGEEASGSKLLPPAMLQ